MTYEYKRVHTSDIRMAYEYIQIKQERIQITCEWHTNDIINIKPYKGFGAFRL